MVIVIICLPSPSGLVADAVIFTSESDLTPPASAAFSRARQPIQRIAIHMNTPASLEPRTLRCITNSLNVQRVGFGQEISNHLDCRRWHYRSRDQTAEPRQNALVLSNFNAFGNGSGYPTLCAHELIPQSMTLHADVKEVFLALRPRVSPWTASGW